MPMNAMQLKVRLNEINFALSNAKKAGRTDDAAQLEQLALKTQGQMERADSSSVPTKNKYAPSAADNFDPTEGMSKFEKLAAGNTQQLRAGSLGARQFVNKFSGGLIGDKEKLAQEAADAEERDRVLLADPWAQGGAIGGRAAFMAPLMTAGGAGVGTAMLPSVLRSMAFGAGEGAVKPGKDYSPNTNALFGAIAGAGGDVGGRTLTRVISPALGATDRIVQGQVERLRERGVPFLAKNLSDNPLIQSLTDTLEKVYPPIKSMSNEQKRIYTRAQTAAAGSERSAVGAGTDTSIMEVPNAKAEAYRARRERIPIGDVPGRLESVLDEHAPALALSGQRQGRMLPNIIRDTNDQRIGAVLSDDARGPPIMSTIDQMVAENTGAHLPNNTLRQRTPSIFDSITHAADDSGLPILPQPPHVLATNPGRGAAGATPPFRASVDQGGAGEAAASGIQGTLADAGAQTDRAFQVPTMSWDDFMTARARLSDIGHTASPGRQAEAHEAQAALEDAARAHLAARESAGLEAPDAAEGFDLWKTQHAKASDIAASAHPTDTAPLDQARMAARMGARGRESPDAGLDQFTMDMAARMKDAPKGDPRSWALAALTGAVPVGSGIYGYKEDKPLATAAAIGMPAAAMWALGSRSGARYMANQALDQSTKDILQSLLTTGATSLNQ